MASRKQLRRIEKSRDLAHGAALHPNHLECGHRPSRPILGDEDCDLCIQKEWEDLMHDLGMDTEWDDWEDYQNPSLDYGDPDW